jgi:hypothetical protein
MLTNLRSSSVKTLVDQIVAEIRDENSQFENNLRAVVREKIIIPVLVCADSGEEVSGFTRDLSAAGACLITSRRFLPGEEWTIDLYRLGGGSSSIVAECRWTRAFGESFWLSGWQFVLDSE